MKNNSVGDDLSTQIFKYFTAVCTSINLLADAKVSVRRRDSSMCGKCWLHVWSKSCLCKASW